MDVFTQMAERRIREAMEEGQFENLEGAGKPLDFSEDRRVPRELWAVYRVLKNSGCLPPELALRKEIRSLQDLMPKATDERELRALVSKINEKILALNLMSTRSGGRSVRNEVAQLYIDKMVGHMRRSAPSDRDSQEGQE